MPLLDELRLLVAIQNANQKLMTKNRQALTEAQVAWQEVAMIDQYTAAMIYREKFQCQFQEARKIVKAWVEHRTKISNESVLAEQLTH